MKNKLISIVQQNDQDFISLTDMVRGEEGSDHIRNWMRNRNTVEFLGLWESLNNPNFKPVEFDTFRKQAGLNSFNLTPKKWIEATNAIGLISKSGRYGGTYAHKDLAFEFGLWISPMFKLLLIKEYQRLKEIESNQYNLEWNVKRILTKMNYQIHTDAVKDCILPDRNYEKDKEWLVYAEEADLLNVVLFNCTAKDWRDANPEHAKKGLNIRDFASINELVVLANLESLNSILIRNNIDKTERFSQLKGIATLQKKALDEKDFLKTLKKISDDVYINYSGKKNLNEESN
ncbi:MAG: KilA-N domain-containing protein [Bacteroidales bacterium]|nr:KilA-N domain-containing protein [Bacteroidales bacterium]MDD3130299.1 KilA-N domain-containing protein [Bacteroidales bacterium]MDY0334093.1 KilA-N domain-containing protein [Bacteroidales bacterium]NLO50583.1 KilA-N domain-containing protein [Bacteroidales bacterium]